MLVAMTDDLRVQRDVDSVRKLIGQNVRAELARFGRSQDWLADLLGVSQPQISKRLSGLIGFEAAELVQIAAELNIPLARLAEAPTPAGAA